MSQEQHEREALIETARLELDRAHRAALNIEAGEVRRGLQLAAAALESLGETTLTARIQAALADLDKGELAEMENLVEAVRKEVHSSVLP